MTKESTAERWLTELLDVERRRAYVDYRTDEYQRAVGELLSLVHVDYVRNALDVVQRCREERDACRAALTTLWRGGRLDRAEYLRLIDKPDPLDRKVGEPDSLEAAP